MQRRRKSGSQLTRRRKSQERRQRRVEHPRLRGSHRRRLPDSLRVLYGAAEDAEQRLFDFMDRAQAADEYMQSFRFADCDYCKVGWFGSALPKPGHCGLSSVDKWNFLSAEPDEWEDGGKRICRACLEEA